jgi:hypothetical protein
MRYKLSHLDIFLEEFFVLIWQRQTYGRHLLELKNNIIIIEHTDKHARCPKAGRTLQGKTDRKLGVCVLNFLVWTASTTIIPSKRKSVSTQEEIAKYM